MTGILSGVRIVDMTSTVMGPAATQLLGDHGADVIKVESPAGDTTRQIPPMHNHDMGCTFLQLNRNKRSVVLNLKDPDHLGAMRTLLRSADVFVYSVRPQAIERLGLSTDVLTELNPRLISVSLVGFGAGGPYSGRPAYEDLIQGLTSVPSLLARVGSPEPHYVPVAFNDRATGLFAAWTMMAALFHRVQTGEAQHVEVPMFEVMAQFVLGDHMGGQAFVPPIGPPGYPRTLNAERRPYPTADGYICAIIYTDDHWRAFAKLIGRPNLIDEDLRFRDFRSRTVHSADTYALVRDEMRTRSTAEWLRILARADIPAAPLHTLESLFDDPHLNATGFFQQTEHPSEGTLLTVQGPTNWSKTPPAMHRAAPRLGEHTEEVLTELGYSTSEANRIANNTAAS